MIGVFILECMMLFALVAPSVPKDALRAWLVPLPPSPQQLHAEIVSRQLASYRQVLVVTECIRKAYESRLDGDYSRLIADLRLREAECHRRIKALERGMLEPIPRMLLALPNQSPFKTPVRD